MIFNLTFPTVSYNEISQTSNIKFSYGLMNSTGDIDVLFKPVRCRDYFNELVQKQLTGKDYAIYGFNTSLVPVFGKDDVVYLTLHGGAKQTYQRIYDTLAKHIPEWQTAEPRYQTKDKLAGFILPRRIYQDSLMIGVLTFMIRLTEQYAETWVDVVENVTWSGNIPTQLIMCHSVEKGYLWQLMRAVGKGNITSLLYDLLEVGGTDTWKECPIRTTFDTWQLHNQGMIAILGNSTLVIESHSRNWVKGWINEQQKKAA